MTLLNTNYLENVVALAGDFLSNANLIFAKNNPLLVEIMKTVNATFTGRGWNSIGSLFQEELESIYV